MSQVRFCPFCGKRLVSGAKFCPYCGNQLTWLMEQKAPPQEGRTETKLPPPPPLPPRVRPRAASWPLPAAGTEATGPCPWLSKKGGGLYFVCNKTRKKIYVESTGFCQDPKRWPRCTSAR